VDFTYLKRALSLTDANLGRHLAVLERPASASCTKGFGGNRPRTRVTLTRSGRTRLHRELDALRNLLKRVRRWHARVAAPGALM
jgi:hypothetical protein